MRHIEPVVPCCFALLVPFVQSFSLARQQHRAPRLLEDDADKTNHDCRHDRLDIENPPPGEILRHEPGHQRAPARAEQRGAREQRHGRVAVFGAVDVGYHAAYHGREGGAAHADEEAHHQHAGVGVREAGAQCADDEEEA